MGFSSFFFFFNCYYQSNDLRHFWISLALPFTAHGQILGLRHVMVSSCYLQQHQILSWEPVSRRNRRTQTSSPFSCRVALLQVARKCCVMVWISQFFHCVFLQCMGAVSESSDLVTLPGPRWIHDLVPLSFSCFLLMCCGNWNNVFCL